MTESYAVAVEDALRRLDVIPDYDAGNGPGPCVHTLVESSFTFLGAHWYLDHLKAHVETYGVEEAGPVATASGHGLVVLEPGRRPLFLATKDAP